MKVYNEHNDNKLTQDLLNCLDKFREKRGFDSKSYIEEKVNIINKYFTKSGLDTAIVAVSGGIDSAATLALIIKASKEKDSNIKKVECLLLPCFDSDGVTNQESATEKGKLLCDEFYLEPIVIDLSEINNSIIDSVSAASLKRPDNWARGQLVSYTRTPVIYYYTSLLSSAGYKPVVCGTINTSEGAYLGYTGKAGDGMVDLQIISDIYKSEVYEVAKALGVPNEIIESVPSGDMYDNRNDTEVFGASYDFVELYLEYLKSSDEVKQKLISDIDEESKDLFYKYSDNLEHLHKYNRHKYIGKSPAVHLDVFNSEVPDGWINYKSYSDDFLKGK